MSSINVIGYSSDFCYKIISEQELPCPTGTSRIGQNCVADTPTQQGFIKKVYRNASSTTEFIDARDARLVSRLDISIPEFSNYRLVDMDDLKRYWNDGYSMLINVKSGEYTTAPFMKGIYNYNYNRTTGIITLTGLQTDIYNQELGTEYGSPSYTLRYSEADGGKIIWNGKEYK